MTFRRALQPLGGRFLAVAVVGLLGVTGQAFAVPEPAFLVFGTVFRDAVLVQQGSVWVEVGSETTPLEIFELGSDERLGDRFALRIPMDTAQDPEIPGAFPGQEARFYLDGELAGLTEIGVPGTVLNLDLDPFFQSEIEISIDDVSVVEGDSGTTVARFSVTLSRPGPSPLAVDWTTVDGTAIGGSDYEPASGRAEFGPGDRIRRVSVNVLGDAIIEDPETFLVRLSNPAGGVIEKADGIGTIEPDDARFVVSVADAEAVETDAPGPEAVFVVTLGEELPGSRAAPTGPVIVTWTTTDGTALADSDYLASTGQLTIDSSVACPGVGVPCGEIRVALVSDNEREDLETFQLTLSNPQNAVLGRDVAVGSIFDDEIRLHYVDTQVEGGDCSDCLVEAAGLTVTPDGSQLLVASSESDALAIYDRDPSGVPVLQTVFRDGVDGVDGLAGAEDVVVSADGLHAYVAGFFDDRIAVFALDAGGVPSFIEAVAGPPAMMDGPIGVDVTPDGAQVVVVAETSNAVLVFDRAGDGRLTHLQTLTEASIGSDGLTGPSDVLVLPGGGRVVVTSSVDSSVVLFDRNVATGELSFLERAKDGLDFVDGIDGATSVASTSDGRFLYVTGELDDALAIFEHGPSRGGTALFFLDRITQLYDGIDGLSGAAGVAVAPDDEWLYLIGRYDDSVSVFALDSTTGMVTFDETRRDGDPDPGGGYVEGLDGSVAMAVGPEDDLRNVYVAGREDSAAVSFLQDTQPPVGPTTFFSPTHPVDVWTSNDQMMVEWSGATDGAGVGVAGYSYVMDTSGTTVPDTTLDLAHTTDPHQLTYGPRPEGISWFHLVTCDSDGNCNVAQHLGPLKVDTVDPSGVADFISTSHVVGMPSSLVMVDFEWTSATDTTSGLAGYSVWIDGSSGAACLESNNTPGGAVSRTLPIGSDGSWYAHICAVDRAGNWGEVSTIGPFTTDTTPPQVVRIDTVSSSGDDALDEGEGTPAGMTQMRLFFSEPTLGLGDLASYLLVEPGPDGDFQTNGCALAGDDVSRSLVEAAVFGGETEVAVVLNGLEALDRSRYRFFVCPTIRDDAGNLLDGDANGTGGDAFLRDFMSEADHFLIDGNFDADLAAWTGGTSWFWDAANDVDGAPRSGSLVAIESFGAAGTRIGQCVAAPIDRFLETGARISIEGPEVDEPILSLALDFYSDAACTDAIPGGTRVDVAVGFTGGWLDSDRLSGRVPAGAGSVGVTWTASGASGGLATVEIDSAFLREPSEVFSDGFESGDTSAW